MTKKEEKERINENYKTLVKHRYFLDRTRVNLSNSFDKYLLTFATGSLGLSISFTNNLKNELYYLPIIAVGWGVLIISIISTLLSIFFSIKSHQKQIDINDFKTKQLFAIKQSKVPENEWNKRLSTLGLFGIFSFICGIILLSTFYFLNLKMAKINQNTPKSGWQVIKSNNNKTTVGEMAPHCKTEKVAPIQKGCSSNDNPPLRPKTK